MAQTAVPRNPAQRTAATALAPDPVAAGRLPPQDLEAEASLLGSMLLDKAAIGQVLQIIARDESHRFYRTDHRLLYETLIELYDRDRPIDIIVLEDELRRKGHLEEVGGRSYLIDLVESVPSAANAEYYAKIVRDKALLRELIGATAQIQQSAYDQQDEAGHILDAAEKRLFEVTEKRVSNQAVSLREFLDQTFRQIETLEEGSLSGVPSGFTELDSMLGGMQYGDLLIVAARPSMGKTALGLSMLDYVGVQERIPCVFFSLEMSKLQIAQRMLCSRAQVDMHKLRHGRLGDREIARLQSVCDEMNSCPVFVDDTSAMSIMELRAKARRLKMLHKIRVVFVDYLQLMVDRASRESRQQEISAISRGLKSLARELGIPVVALAQLNRQVEGREGNRPRMSDLRESGAIEQDADVVLLLHREEYYIAKKKAKGEAFSEVYDKVKGKAEIIIAKQRNGPTGEVELHFTPQYARFDNAAPGYIHDDGLPPGGNYGDVAYNPEGPGEGDEAAPF